MNLLWARRASLPFILAFGLTACQQEVVIERQVPTSVWGKTFVINPLSQADDATKNDARAVANVRLVSGGGATGFFVSPDGLFLTNHHVISRSACSKERCSGIQIVRHLTPNGDIEVFNRFELLAHSEYLDFALVKVDIGNQPSVPFLPLATASEFDPKLLPNAQLLAIGHPALSSLRVTPLKFARLSDTSVVVNGPVLGGNSGSPLLDRKSGKVVGLIANSVYNDNRSDRSGNFTIDNNAYRIDATLTALRQVYPSARVATDGSLKTGDISASAGSMQAQSIAPARFASTEALEQLPMPTFLGMYLGRSDESKGVAAVLAGVESRYPVTDEMSAFLDDLYRGESSSGLQVRFTQAEKDRISRIVFQTGKFDQYFEPKSENEGWIYFYWAVRSGALSRNECLLQGWISEYEDRALYCHSSVSWRGNDIASELVEKKAWYLDKSAENYQARLNIALFTIKERLTLSSSLSPAQRTAFLDLLEAIIADSERMNVSLGADGLLTYLQRDPALVGPGYLRATY